MKVVSLLAPDQNKHTDVFHTTKLCNTINTINQNDDNKAARWNTKTD